MTLRQQSALLTHFREPLGPLPKGCYKNNFDVSAENLILTISEKEVYGELRNVNIFKSFGPDNIHSKLLHALADNSCFVSGLCHLYNKCIED